MDNIVANNSIATKMKYYNLLFKEDPSFILLKKKKKIHAHTITYLT